MANVLGPGESLRPGESLFSTNRSYELRLQADGNLVLYRTRDWRALWSSKTQGHAVSALFMQVDGNLVLYSGAEAVWSSKTYGPAISYLVVQDDGNVVIYRQGPVAWNTATRQ
jgi:hypothetical protein